MAKEKTYYNIRVVQATTKNKAIEKVNDYEFDEMNCLCDSVLTTEELINELLLQLEEEKNNKNEKNKKS